MAERRTATPDARAEEAIHDTQTSLEAISSDPARRSAQTDPEISENADTLLSGPSPEDDLHAEVNRRLGAVEVLLVELQARVRLLEKQEPAPRGMIHWFIALLFFVALAVSWQLISAVR
jgi:hypothetical protein